SSSCLRSSSVMSRFIDTPSFVQNRRRVKAQNRIGGFEERHASGFALPSKTADTDFRKSTKAVGLHE
ncbi:hypothetical protein ABTK27_19135, partial [Acinetobacter baumannii]